jgi:hypothetical protein
MVRRIIVAACTAFVGGTWAGAALAQNCSGAPVYFTGDIAEVEGATTVRSGTACGFGVSGIPGAVTEVVISQKPRVGQAGVQGLRPYYAAKRGYQGPDEFAYTFIGTGRYGGPMRVTIKRKITVVP